ncbi:MAG TPA: SDR family NAD(P)-dependent oxidoreductase [Candidatus Lokiarchaeia archaeon]
MFKNKKICVFGGSGSIGREIVSQLLDREPNVVRIFSNDENGLFDTKQEFGETNTKIRCILGDIRDLRAVEMALKDIDYCINAAAYKHVEICEYNPIQAVSTNIIGLNNIIIACFYNNVERLLQISTDKAIEPSSTMGATKMIGERICKARNFAKGTHRTIISCVRFGNVLGSRGSLVPKIQEQIRKGFIVTLTDEKMKRYLIEKKEAGKFIINTLEIMQGGEIFVPKLKEILIKDLIQDIINQYAPLAFKDPNSIQIKIIGSYPGEKLTEKLLTEEELSRAIDKENMWVIK